MNHNAHIVIWMTIVLCAACDPAPPPSAGPLERASKDEPVLTSTVVDTPGVAEALPKADTEATKPARALGVEDAPDEPVEKKKLAPEPTLESEDGLSIRRLITAPEVEHREPVAATSTFGDDGRKIYAFVDVENASERDRSLQVFFIAPSGRVTGGVELLIPAKAPRWRTWAYTRNADELGVWRVEVRSDTGALVGSLPFEVAEGC